MWVEWKLDKFSWICDICREDDKLPGTPLYIPKRNSTYKSPQNINKLSEHKNKLILHMNCRSVGNKIDEIGQILSTVKPLILCLSETWLDCSHPPGYLHFKGYKSIGKDRSDDIKQKYGKAKGGGVAVIFREDLQVTHNKDLDTTMDETLWANIKAMGHKILLGVIYPPQY